MDRLPVSLHAPRTALRMAAFRVAGQYLYHSTLADSLSGIAERGLDPAYGGGNFAMEGWSEGKVFFSDDPQKALYYGENAMSRKWDFRKDPPVLLRVPAALVETERDKYGDFYTERIVPPNLLEAKTPEGWQPLDEEMAENARDIFGEQYLGRDRPVLFAPDFSPEASVAAALATAATKLDGHRVELTGNDRGGVTAFLFDAGGEQVDDAYADIHMGTADDFQGEPGEYDYFNPNEPIEESGTVAVLTGLELPEDIRGRGLGREMVEAVTRWALSRAAEAVYTHAVGAPGDPDPEGFYEKLGFEVVDRDSVGNPYMRLGPGRTAAREPVFLKRLRDAGVVPPPGVASAALSSVASGTLIHSAAGSTGTPGEDLTEKIQSILDHGVDPAYWARPWSGSPGEGHPQAVYLSLAWEAILDNPPPNYVFVESRLSRPLVLWSGDKEGNYIWGQALNDATGKSGIGLSSFLRARGYDSIIAVRQDGTVGEVAYFGKEPLPAFLPESDHTSHTLGAAAEIMRRTAAVEDIYRGVKTVIEKYRGRGLFARFSDVPKIGIRPSTEHHDPYGVYFYPVDWLAENAGFGTTYVNLPYITVARIRRSGWLNLGTIRPAKARQLAERGGVLDEYEAQSGGRAGKRLWDAVEAQVKPFESAANKLEWNRIFGRMGVKAVYDPGTGSVNSAEPAQIVVLDLSLIEVVDVVENREDRKSVFYAVLKAVADEVLDEWRVAGSHAEGGIWAAGSVGGAPVEMSVMPAKAGFEMEVTLSYHDPSGKKRRIVSRGRMPNEWEDAPASYLSEGHAASILRKLEEAELGTGAEDAEDAEDLLDGALRALTKLRLPDLTVKEKGEGAEFRKNTGDGKVQGSLKVLPGGRRELELYAEDWLLFGGEDSSVIELGPMRVSWEGDPSSAAADVAAELSRAVRELRVTDDEGEPRKDIDRDSAAEIVRMRTLSWMFPDDILEAAGLPRKKRETAAALRSARLRLAGQQHWHGSSGENIRKIAAAGFVDPGVPEGHSGRGYQKPMPGRSYATTDLGYALIYAIEAAMVGKELPRDTARFDGDGGIVSLEGEGGALPDEDWVGELISDCESRRRRQRGDPNARSGEPPEWKEKLYSDLRRNLPNRVVSMIDRKPTWKLDEMATQSMIGKNVNRWLLKQPPTHFLRKALVARSPHHSYPGRMMVTGAWVFDKREVNPKLKEDGSNFLDLATEIPVGNSSVTASECPRGDHQSYVCPPGGVRMPSRITPDIHDAVQDLFTGACTCVRCRADEAKVASEPLKAWHGTSDAYLDLIRESGGLKNPYLAATPELAEYYAEAVAEDDGGEAIVLEIDVRDTSRLRYDGAAMDEPVTVGVDEDDRDAEWGRAEEEHPEWVHGGMISIPPEEWGYSWRGAHSVRYDGLLPLADIGGDIREASSRTPFSELPDAVRADITENLHDALFAGTDVSHEVLRDVLADMDTPLAVGRLPVAGLARQVRARHSISDAAVTGLVTVLRRAGDLDPILTADGRFRDGGHRVMAYEAEGRDSIPAVDISPLLAADWEAEFREEIPGLARAARRVLSAAAPEPWQVTQAEFIEILNRSSGKKHLQDYEPRGTESFAHMNETPKSDIGEVTLPDGGTLELKRSERPVQWGRYVEQPDGTDRYESSGERPEETVFALVDGRVVGYAGNSFGATEMFLSKDEQGRGIGPELYKAYLEEFPHRQTAGGFTSAGLETAKATHRKFVEEAVAAGKPVPPEVLADYPHGFGSLRATVEFRGDEAALEEMRGYVETYGGGKSGEGWVRMTVRPANVENIAAMQGFAEEKGGRLTGTLLTPPGYPPAAARELAGKGGWGTRAMAKAAALDLWAVRKFLEGKWDARGRPEPGENCVATASFLAKLIPGAEVRGGQPEGHRDLVRHGLATEDEARSGGGYRDDGGYLLPHLWVEAGGRIYDLTADQFGGDPVTMADAGDARYVPSGLSEKNARALRAVDAETDAWLEEWESGRTASSDPRYPMAGDLVDGRRVLAEVPNTSSISASFDDWHELPGIREVPMSDFGGPRSVFYAADDFRRSRELASRIRESGEIKPLIVAVDDGGPYILEGAHRFVALHGLGAKSFPALVVIDRDDDEEAPPGRAAAGPAVEFEESAEMGIHRITATVGGDEVGTLEWQLHPNARRVNLVYVGVDPGRRDAGIGEALLRRFEESARAAGAEGFYGDVTSLGAMRLVERVFGPPADTETVGAVPGRSPEDERGVIDVHERIDAAWDWGESLTAALSRAAKVYGSAPDLTPPENAAPAEPDKDFTVNAKQTWTPLLDIYGEFLDGHRASATDAHWYHGTSEAAEEAIRSGGEVRPPFAGSNVSLGGAYLTKRRDLAEVYARGAARAHGSEPVVLTVTANESDLLPDEDWPVRLMDAGGDEIDGRLQGFLDDLFEGYLGEGHSLSDHYKVRYDELNRDHGITWQDSLRWSGSVRQPYPLSPDQLAGPAAAALSRAARALGEHLGETVAARRPTDIPGLIAAARERGAENLVGGNCGQFALGLARFLKDKGAHPDPRIGLIHDGSSETVDDLRDGEPDIYHVFLDLGGEWYDATGGIGRQYLDDFAAAEYGDPAPDLVTGLPPDEGTRRIISFNTDWDLEWDDFYRIFEEETGAGTRDVEAALSRAARALGEHLGETVTAYRALAAEHMERIMREGFTGGHHRHGVYYTANRERAAFYARFMASARLQGVVFEMEVDTSRSQADVNDATEQQSEELFEEVKSAAGDMAQAVRDNADVRLWDSDVGRLLESWLGGLTVSEGFYEAPTQHSVWQLLADETKGTDDEMTIADAREALPPGRYGEMTVLDSRGVAGIDAGEIPGQAQAMSSRGVPAERLTAVWIPSALLEAAGEEAPAGAETMADHVDVIPAKFDVDYDTEFTDEIRGQRDRARRLHGEDPPKGMGKGDEDGWYSGLEELADALDGILERWESERDSTMPGHIYSKLIRGERVTPEDLDREERLVRFPLPEGRLRAAKVVRKAIAAAEPGQARRRSRGGPPMRLAGWCRRDSMDERLNAMAKALRQAAEDIGWSEESDVDPESFVDEGFVEDPSGHAFWGSQGSGTLFVRNHPEDGPQLLLVKRSPHVEEPNTWGTTGGAVPQGESNLFASAIRETREEIGNIPPYEAVRKYVWKATGGTFTYTTFILECTDMDWLPTTFNWEATDARWVSLDEAASYDLHFGLQSILGDLGKSIFPATRGVESE